MDNLWITRARVPLGPLRKLQTPLTYISQFSGLLCELVYAPGARRFFLRSWRFFLADLLGYRVDNWRSRIYKRSCSLSCRMGRKRDRIGLLIINNTLEDCIGHLPGLDVYALNSSNSPCTLLQVAWVVVLWKYRPGLHAELLKLT